MITSLFLVVSQQALLSAIMYQDICEVGVKALSHHGGEMAVNNLPENPEDSERSLPLNFS